MPLVLVHNDVVANPNHQWNDVEGVHYHYPSKYRGKVKKGEPFVYYRGIHRANGKRGPAEYVGAGLIGDIWADPTRKNAWYCGIDNYERFPSPVSAKVGGVNREDIPANLWRDGVRVLAPEVYETIVNEAAVAATAHPLKISPQQAQLAQVQDLILPSALAKHQGTATSRRQSKRSKEIGDWAEQVALAYIKRQIAGCSQCAHRAALGETPGWDIDYCDAAGVLQRVEVKGTISAAFAAIELTSNELAAAKQYAEHYWLCLVAKCETEQPKIQLIQNPAQKIAAGEWSVAPTIFAVRLHS